MTLEHLSEALNLIMSWQVFLASFIGLLIGLILGAIPGITGSVAMAVSLTITFYLEPIVAIMFLSSCYTGGITGGSISAILLNMPGAPGSVATSLDGFQLTKAGRHNHALGLALYSSFAGCFFSYLMMCAVLGPVTGLVGNIGPADRVAVAFSALLILAAIRGKRLLRSLIACSLGLVFSTLGTSQTGALRSEFLNLPMLYDGLPLVPTVIGLLAFSELIAFIRQPFVIETTGTLPKPSFVKILSTAKSWIGYWRTTCLGTVIGFLVGVVPAAGSSVACLFAYGQAKSWSNYPEKFGQGVSEGVVAAESANNASEGGSMLTTLALGIPGSGAAAILMSGFMMFGLTPGPVWISQNLPFAYAIVIGNLIFAIIMLFVGAIMMAQIAPIIYVPVKFLAPSLVIVSSAGIYTLRGSIFDICVAWFFAYLGYILKRSDYPPIGILLGLVLGPIIESEIYRVNIIYEGEFLSLLFRPVVIISIIAGIFLLLSPFIRSLFSRKKGEESINV